MSIDNKLNTLLTTKNAIKQALQNKGQEVGDVFSEYPQIIENMDVGGGSNEIWTPNPDWPDVQKILLETPLVEGSKGSCIILIPAGQKVLNWYGFGNTSYFYNIVGMLLSDGTYYKMPTTSYTLQHTWDQTKDFVSAEGNKHRWIIFFTKHNSMFDLQKVKWQGNETTYALTQLKYIVMNNCRIQFDYNFKHSLECVKSVQPITIYQQNLNGLFYGCKNLVCTKNITWGDAVECSGVNAFTSCTNLKEVPPFNPQLKFTDVKQMFYGCQKLKKFPEINCSNDVINTGLMYISSSSSSGDSSINWQTCNINWINQHFDQNLYLQCFYDFSEESFQKLVEKLAPLSDGQTANTVYFSKYYFNQVMTEQQKSQITKKGWNISSK